MSGREREGGDVELEAGLDRPHLLARSCVGLREVDVVPGRGLLERGMSFPYASRGVEYATMLSFVSALRSGAAEPMPAVAASAAASTPKRRDH